MDDFAFFDHQDAVGDVEGEAEDLFRDDDRQAALVADQFQGAADFADDRRLDPSFRT